MFLRRKLKVTRRQTNARGTNTPRRKTIRWLLLILIAGLILFQFWSLLLLDPADQDTSIQTASKLSTKSGQQQLIFLAGPHKTGTSSMQTNLWKWSTNLDDHNDNNRHNTNSRKSALPNWVWPVPPSIVKIESSDPHPWEWTPAKGFYPLIEALRNYTIYPNSKPTRTLFQQYQQHQIVNMYTDYIHQVLNDGYDIIMGTEAMDSLVKDSDGVEILNRLANVLSTDTATMPMTKPTSTTSQNTKARISIVIVYRTPKARHLISIWHQNALKRTDPGFYDWITTTGNNLGALDALGMVDLIVRHPAADDWNIVLVDLSGVKEDGWDLSNLIACEVMHVECDTETKGLMGLSDEENPILANVREDTRPPDMGKEVFDRMEVVMRGYDCNYQHLFFDDKYKERLKILHPFNLLQIMKGCRKNANPYPPSRKAMKEEIVKLALASGKIDGSI